MTVTSLDKSSIKHILVIKLRHHGDVLLTTPVFNALKEQLPQAEADILIYAETRDMIQYHPNVNQIFCVDRKWKEQGNWHLLKQEWKLFQQLENRHYDLILNLSSNWRGAWLCRLLKPQRSSAELYTRRNKPSWQKSFTHPTPRVASNCLHTIERNLKPLQAIGLKYPNQIKYDMGISGEVYDKISQEYKDEGIHKKKIAHIHPGARWQFKCWENHSWQEIIRFLLSKDLNIVLTAAPSEQEILDIKEILSGNDDERIYNHAGKFSLQELAASISQASFFIGVDSAPMHMAAALGIPCLALFGPSKINEWSPWGETSAIILGQSHNKDLDAIDTQQDQRMLKDITVKNVIEQLEKSYL